MNNWKRNLLFAWLSQFFSLAGFSLSMPFIPFYFQSLGVSEITEVSMWVAQFTAIGYLCVGLFAPVWGFLADIYGRRLMLLRANFASALVLPLMAFAPNPLSLVVLRGLLGIFAGTASAAQILIAGNTPHEKRGVALGILSSAIFSGMMAGTFIGGLVVDAFGYTTTFFTGGILLILAGATAFAIKEDFKHTTSLKEKWQHSKLRLPVLGPIWFILILIMFMGYARQFDQPFLPLMVETIHGSDKAASWTGIIGSITAVAGILSGVLLGWLADRVSAPKVAMLSTLLAAMFLIPQGLATGLGFFIGARFMTMFFAGGLDPVFQIWLAKSTPDKDRGLLLGFSVSAKCTGWVACSLSGGYVAMFMGIRWVYFAAAIAYLLLVPIIILAVKRIKNSM
jgi:MFS transporter, DHA1 family, multidrug resistance protein